MSSYRICRLSYYAYPRAFAALDGHLCTGASYDQLTAVLFADSPIYSDAFAGAMRRLGNDAVDLIYNAEPIQRRWAEEHGVGYSERRWMRDIFFAQLDHYRPDVVYLQGVNWHWAMPILQPEFRERFPFVRFLVGYSGNVVDVRTVAPLDLVLAGVPPFYQRYRQMGKRCVLMYHGFDEANLERVERWRRGAHGGGAQDFIFAGSTGYGWRQSHRGRYWELLQLLLSSPLKLWAFESRDAIPAGQQVEAPPGLRERMLAEIRAGGDAGAMVARLRRMQSHELGNDEPVIPLAELFPERCSPAVYGTEMLDLLARSRITYNRHTDQSEGYAGNMRLFEATGMGACLATERTVNIAELYEPDSEVVTYSSIEECCEKVEYLLEHEHERAAIAAAGQRRTLRDHTVLRRCEMLDELIKDHLAASRATAGVGG